MLWHLEHRHTGATCFSKDEEKKALWDKAMEVAPENGVKVQHFLVNASAHRFFFVLKRRIMNPWKRHLGNARHWAKLK